MARKAVQGYTEKSYYDNTKFLGTVATNDPVSEGYFRQLVNFDISDTGQSLTPRKGFITTSLCTPDGERITLSKNTIIYKDNRIQQYIIYDFKNRCGYRADLDADALRPDNLLEATEIAHYDLNDIYEYLLQRVNKDVEPDISNINNFKEDIDRRLSIYSEGSVITDSDAVQKYVMKCEYSNPELYPNLKYIFLVGIFYRKDAVDSQGLSADTLVFTVIDLDQQPSVYTYDRNLASFKSIIPEKKQTVYASNEAPDGFVNEFPIIYAETVNGYLLNTYQTPSEFKIIPRFALEEAADGSQWAYAYEIIKRKTTPIWDSSLDANVSYKSPIFYLNDHQDVYTPYRVSDALEQSDTDYERINKVPLIIVVPAELNAPEFTENDAWNESHESIYLKLHDRFSNDSKYYATTKLNELKNLFKNVNTKEALIEAVQTVPDRYRFYLNTFENTYRGYDTALGTLLSRDYLASDILLTKLSLGEDIDSNTIIRNNYADGTISKKELLEFLKTSNDTQFMFKFLPIAFRCSFFDSFSSTVYAQFPRKYIPNEPGGVASFYVYLAGNPFTVTDVEGTIKLVYESDSNHIRVKKNDNINSFIELTYHEGYGREGSIFTKDSNGDLYTRFNSAIPVTYECEVCGGDGQINEDSGFSEECWNCGGEGTITPSSNPREYVFRRLNRQGFFTEGFTMIFYLISITPNSSYIPYPEFVKRSLASTPFIQTLSLNKSVHPPTYITQVLTKEPKDIQESVNYTTYNNERLVVWHNNTVYISEAGDYYYFKYSGMHEFGERVVKVIQFKTILLVFTVQHLYAIFETEIPIQTINAEGTLETTSTFEWASLPVLYNILTSDKYADAIQVFNQMVLFYSEDGQMFMIKPSTTIDSDTRFSLQYFNKAVNDILLNYDIYINERLQSYGIEQTITKDDVRIKALLSVNFIKLFFYVPGLITYIVIYDVINNRYQVYDTTTFTNIKDKMFVESGDLLITEQDDALYFTAQHTDIFDQDGNVDLAITNNFKKEPINALIDTGNINLNNHLIKRYRDLFITFKNISSKELLYNVETVLDDVVVKPHYSKTLEIRNIHNTSVYTEVAVSNERDLAALYTDDNNISNGANMLMDFSGFNSNKLITHRSSILGMSRVIRVRLQFKSKGVYKIQNFGFVFKERRI